MYSACRVGKKKEKGLATQMSCLSWLKGGLICQVSIYIVVEGDEQDEATWSQALSLRLSAARKNPTLVQFLPSPMPPRYGLWHEAPVDLCLRTKWHTWELIQSFQQSCLTQKEAAFVTPIPLTVPDFLMIFRFVPPLLQA